MAFIGWSNPQTCLFSYNFHIFHNNKNWFTFLLCSAKKCVLMKIDFRLIFFSNKQLQNVAKKVSWYSFDILFPVGIYLPKVNNKNTRKSCKIFQKLTKKDTRTTSIDITTQLTGIALVYFFLTLNILCFLCYCFLC